MKFVCGKRPLSSKDFVACLHLITTDNYMYSMMLRPYDVSRTYLQLHQADKITSVLLAWMLAQAVLQLIRKFSLERNEISVRSIQARCILMPSSPRLSHGTLICCFQALGRHSMT